MKIKHSKNLSVLLICLLVIGIEIYLLIGAPKPSTPESKIQTYAKEVIAACASSSYHPTCYDKVIPQLMDKISMEDAFQVASIVQNQDNTYGYCHILGHELAAKETEKDPQNWKDVIHRCPQGVCSNGCLHGAAQERFRGEILNDTQIVTAQNELLGVCDNTKTWSPTGLETSECFHGLGHLTMYMTGADLAKALSICDKIAVSGQGVPYTNLCYEGAFMQLFQPADADDLALVKGKGPETDTKLAAFCKGFGTDAKTEACWREGFILYSEQIHTGAGSVTYCTNSIVKDVDGCYLMLAYVNAQSDDYDTAKLTDYCTGMPGNLSANCFGNVANAILHGGYRQIDKATGFCALAPAESQGTCYEIMVTLSTYNLPSDSEQYLQLCQNMPDPYKSQCLAKKTVKSI